MLVWLTFVGVDLVRLSQMQQHVHDERLPCLLVNPLLELSWTIHVGYQRNPVQIIPPGALLEVPGEQDDLPVIQL